MSHIKSMMMNHAFLRRDSVQMERGKSRGYKLPESNDDTHGLVGDCGSLHQLSAMPKRSMPIKHPPIDRVSYF